MAIIPPTTFANLPRIDRAAEPRNYSMYGLRVRSDLLLPFEPEERPNGSEPEVRIRRMAADQSVPDADRDVIAEWRCYGSCHNGRVAVTVSRGATGTWFWHDGVSTCRIWPEARQIDVYPAIGASDQEMALVLSTHVFVYLLHQLGYPPLHASAVVANRQAFAFIGPPGRGKSTLAAYFLRRGATLLTDDALPLRTRDDGIDGAPGLPMMKLWAESVEFSLGLAEDLPDLGRNSSKKLLALATRYGFAETLVPLRAVYVLDRYDAHAAGRTDVSIQRLGQREALATLLANVVYRSLLLPREQANLFRAFARVVGQVPVHSLSYPDGFEYQDAVYRRITGDREEE